mmetsp:Transcript_27297/g.55196  ORF Transcript_27297/g.55196 Transcript_27297/m.55196 type:complete len:162 (+) Transcript_27297:71-556(+)
MVVVFEIEDGTVEKSGVVYYSVLVKNESGRQWSLLKRYTDFAELHQRLRSEGVLSTAELPGKGNASILKLANNALFLEQRKEGLRQYLAHLAGQVQTVTQHPALGDFLEEFAPARPVASDERLGEDLALGAESDDERGAAGPGVVNPGIAGSSAARLVDHT